MARRAYWSLLLLCSLGCEGQQPAAAPQPAPPAVQAAKTSAGDTGAIAANAVPSGHAAGAELDAPPVEADYEEQAERELTLENVGAALDALEKEIGEPLR